MPDLARKLGIKTHHSVHLHSAPASAAALIREAAPEGVEFTEKLGRRRYDIILYWPKKLARLAEHFARLQRYIRPDGSIWVVMPKKNFASERGIDFSLEQMQAAGLQTDLVDNKDASISEEEYATRFVIRKERRGKYASP